MNFYFQMPFRRKARITLENQHANAIPAFFYQIDYGLHEELPEDIAYFHAQWRREKNLVIVPEQVENQNNSCTVQYTL